MITDTDIDIDLADRDFALAMINHVAALQKDDVTRHASGVYFQNIPQDPLTGLAAIPNKRAAELGYFKIDLLNNSIYKNVRDEEHLVQLAFTDPPWELFGDKNVVKQLQHIRNYFWIVDSIKPKSVEDLAVIIALIRPGKKHLVGKPRDQIDAEIWLPVAGDDGEGYSFKKSHAHAFSLSIVVQLNLLIEKFSDKPERMGNIIEWIATHSNEPWSVLPHMYHVGSGRFDFSFANATTAVTFALVWK
ncbi:unnamed protein product [Sphagnum tenellum]